MKVEACENADSRRLGNQLARLPLPKGVNETSPPRGAGYHSKGLRPDNSGRHPSPQQAAGNCAVPMRLTGLDAFVTNTLN